MGNTAALDLPSYKSITRRFTGASRAVCCVLGNESCERLGNRKGTARVAFDRRETASEESRVSERYRCIGIKKNVAELICVGWGSKEQALISAKRMIYRDSRD